MYEWLVFGHVVGVVLWAGGSVVGSVLALRMRRSGIDEKLTTLEVFERMSPVFPIGAVLVIGFGTWMVIDRETIGFGDAWLLVAYAAIVLTGVVQAVVTPRLERARRLLEAGDPAAHDHWARLSMVLPLDTVLLLVAVWAMTTKPGA